MSDRRRHNHSRSLSQVDRQYSTPHLAADDVTPSSATPRGKALMVPQQRHPRPSLPKWSPIQNDVRCLAPRRWQTDGSSGVNTINIGEPWTIQGRRALNQWCDQTTSEQIGLFRTPRRRKEKLHSCAMLEEEEEEIRNKKENKAIVNTSRIWGTRRGSKKECW